MSSKPTGEEKDFDWIKLRNDMVQTETTKEKLIRKMKSNPVVPFGCLLTAFVLGLGLRSLTKGDRVQSQKMMRWRIAAQGFTVAALMGGMVMAARKITPHEEKTSK